MILRPYQREAVEAVLKAPERAVAIALATGLGKTAIAAEIVRRTPQRTLFVVPSTELMRQAARAIAGSTMLGDGMRPEKQSRVLVATIQSISTRPELAADYQHLIIDEMHHAASKSYENLIGLPFERIVGLSATVFRADGKPLRQVVDRVVYERDIHWGIANGYLAPYRLIRPTNAGSLPLTIERYVYKGEQGRKDLIRQRLSYDHAQRNDIVASLVNQLMDDEGRKHGIMFCATVQHAEAMARALGDGWDWCSADNRAPVDAFKAGKLRGIVSVQLLLEGFDFPPADFLAVNAGINADSTGAIRWIQLLGRVLRLSEGKTGAIALDLSRTGLPDIEYKSNLDGEENDDQDGNNTYSANTEIDIVERLENPTNLTVEQLLAALDIVNQRRDELMKTLGTRLRLHKTSDGRYQVVGSRWVIWQEIGLWCGTDGVSRFQNKTTQQAEEAVAPLPAFGSERPATQKQIDILAKSGINDAAVLTSRQASDLISQRIAAKGSSPATPKQIGFIRWKTGRHPGDITKAQAARIINSLRDQ